MLKEISPEKFKELLKKGYSLDLAYLLMYLDATGDIEELTLANDKIAAMHATLIRKGLISENKLTKDGKELIEFLSTKDKFKISRTKVKDEEFDLFWNAYPGTDTFEYKGKKFTGTRALKVRKDDCRTKIKAILNEGDYKMEDIVAALKLEVQQKVEASYKEGKNKISYMQNSLTWLNQRSFEPFIELVKAGHTAEETKKYTKGVDI